MAEPPVVNTSPFIVLAQGGRLGLLQGFHERVCMPREVAREVRRRGVGDAAVRALAESVWIDMVDAGQPPESLRGYRLDAGEEAVLTWALAHPGAVTIIDDRRGRSVARTLSIPVVGTLGLVLDAKERGTIPAARPVIKHLLRATGWYLSPVVVNGALARVGE